MIAQLTPDWLTGSSVECLLHPMIAQLTPDWLTGSSVGCPFHPMIAQLTSDWLTDFLLIVIGLIGSDLITSNIFSVDENFQRIEKVFNRNSSNPRR